MTLDTETNTHLVTIEEEALFKILDGGKQTIASFSKTRSSPYDVINKGDKIYLKTKSGPVMAEAISHEIAFYANLNPEKMRQFKFQYSEILQMPHEQWKEVKDSRYITTLMLKDVEEVLPSDYDTIKSTWQAS